MMVSIVFPFHHSPLTRNKLCLMPAARMIEAGAEGVSQDRGQRYSGIMKRLWECL